MTLRYLPRARARADAPEFAAVWMALQRAVFHEHRGAWDRCRQPPGIGRFAGQRVWRLARDAGRTSRQPARLADATAALLQALDVGRWQLLPLTRDQAWDGGDDTGRVHPPLRRARQRLQTLGLPAGFAGALQFDAADLPDLMPLWFWTARCRAGAYGPYAGAPGLPLMASLCQYGFLHLEVYDPALLQRLDALGPRCGWRLVQGPCPEAYAQGPAVTGRRLRT